MDGLFGPTNTFRSDLETSRYSHGTCGKLWWNTCLTRQADRQAVLATGCKIVYEVAQRQTESRGILGRTVSKMGHTYCPYKRRANRQLSSQIHGHMFTVVLMHLVSFSILSLVLVTANFASILTSSACNPGVFNNPVLFCKCKLLHSHENHKPMSL